MSKDEKYGYIFWPIRKMSLNTIHNLCFAFFTTVPKNRLENPNTFLLASCFLKSHFFYFPSLHSSFRKHGNQSMKCVPPDFLADQRWGLSSNSLTNIHWSLTVSPPPTTRESPTPDDKTGLGGDTHRWLCLRGQGILGDQVHCLLGRCLQKQESLRAMAMVIFKFSFWSCPDPGQ